MKPIKDKKCKQCGELFTPKRSTLERICSPACALMEKQSKAYPPKKPKRIAPMSKAMQSRLHIYRIRRDEYMKQNMICEVKGCATPSHDLHHKSGRIGSNLTDQATFMAVCRKCHNWIHEHPAQAREKQYLK